jgi:predicted amidohydrolase
MLQYAGELRGASSVSEGLARVQAAHPGVRSFDGLFLEQSAAVQRILVGVFSPLARRHRLAIVAGSAFVAARSAERGEELRNRAFVFDRDGGLLHTQDKVSLTDFERDAVGLAAGRLEDASPFAVAGARVGLTLCRDAFFPEWEEVFRGVDLWIDIKANGVPFTEEERASFARALPARLPRAGVRHGITACLVGSFLDLAWEGESSVVEQSGGVVRTLTAAASPRTEALLRGVLDVRQR